MVRLLHGTSADNLDSVLRYGLDPNRASSNPNWTCSSAQHIYFWHPLRFEGDTFEERWQGAFNNAANSAEFCLAKAKDCRRLVIEVDIPRADFSPDISCRYMDEAVQVNRVVRPDEIRRLWIDSESLDFFRAYFALLRLDRALSWGVDLSTAEESMVRALKLSDTFSCEMYETLSELTEYMEEIPVPMRQFALAS